MRPACVAGYAVCLAAFVSGCSIESRWKGPVTDHFDGQVFHDEQAFTKSYRDLFRFLQERPPSQWVRDMTIEPGPPPEERVGWGELRVTFVNHATVLLQFDGVNLLTDPIWSKRAGPTSMLGAQRFRPAGIAFDDLPPIDAVIVSHNHFDHLDVPTLLRLQQLSSPRFFVPPGDAVWLRQRGLKNLTELDWDESAILRNGCALTAQRSRHWSQRRIMPRDRNYSLWDAYVLMTSQGPVYFAGDTGYGPHFGKTREAFGPMRLALLPIGAYLPRWFMDYQHMNPAEAVTAHDDLGALQSIGIHWGTFELAADGPTQPLLDLAHARAAAGLDPDAFIAPEHGQGRNFEPVDQPMPSRCLQPTRTPSLGDA